MPSKIYVLPLLDYNLQIIDWWSGAPWIMGSLEEVRTQIYRKYQFNGERFSAPDSGIPTQVVDLAREYAVKEFTFKFEDTSLSDKNRFFKRAVVPWDLPGDKLAFLITGQKTAVKMIRIDPAVSDFRG